MQPSPFEGRKDSGESSSGPCPIERIQQQKFQKLPVMLPGTGGKIDPVAPGTLVQILTRGARFNAKLVLAFGFQLSGGHGYLCEVGL